MLCHVNTNPSALLDLYCMCNLQTQQQRSKSSFQPLVANKPSMLPTHVSHVRDNHDEQRHVTRVILYYNVKFIQFSTKMCKQWRGKFLNKCGYGEEFENETRVRTVKTNPLFPHAKTALNFGGVYTSTYLS